MLFSSRALGGFRLRAFGLSGFKGFGVSGFRGLGASGSRDVLKVDPKRVHTCRTMPGSSCKVFDSIVCPLYTKKSSTSGY